MLRLGKPLQFAKVLDCTYVRVKGHLELLREEGKYGWGCVETNPQERRALGEASLEK